jgi:hypothetical protein
VNFVSPGVAGATIGGGGSGEFNDYTYINQVSADFGTVSGGAVNTILMNAQFATVGGGGGNLIQSNGYFATIPGGVYNSATGYAFAAGYRAKANHSGAFVWADFAEADFASTGSNQFLIRASGGVAIGANDPAGAMLRVAGAIKADSYLGAGGTLLLGTTDNQPLELKVNGTRALRLEPNTSGGPNIIGGSPNNSVAPGIVGATVGGGGALSYLGNAYANQVSGDFGTVGGGANNTSSGTAATTAGGLGNTAGNLYATVSGGAGNISSGFASTVGGGFHNTNSGESSTLSGGSLNTSSQYGSTVGGGVENVSSGQGATVVGGRGNRSSGVYATAGGGYLNDAAGAYSFAAGLRAKANHSGAFVWADSADADLASTAANQFLIRAAGGVGINKNNPATALDVNGTVTATTLSAGNVGIGTATPNQKLQIVGPENSSIDLTTGPLTLRSAVNSVAGAGVGTVSSHALTLFTGNIGRQTITADGRVGINKDNPATALDVNGTATVTTLSAGNVGIGTATPSQKLNIVGPENSAIDLTTGTLTLRSSVNSIAGAEMGTVSSHSLAFLTGNIARQTITADGKVGINKNNPATALDVNGTVTATAFNPPSDRNLKENFASVSPRETLQKVLGLSISRWNFKSDPTTPHVGPMAQDFYAAFGLGTDEKHIATVDADGVALAAIQGLNAKLEEKETRIVALEKALSELQQAMKSISEKKN